MKRVFDCIIAISALLLLSSILIIIIILIFTSSGRPIFFVQSRIGRYGKAFSMIKFRTMSLSQVSDSTISIKGDVRITKIGMFLRKYKLDELPELWNILVGDMSLVGPRPDVPGYADRLEGEDMLILDLRPGITGPASLKYVNEEEVLALQDDPVKYNDDVIYPDKVRLNLDYYYNNNLWLDIKIIFATIFRTSY
jgi:lipopolysaccharide/colanic/teichoic acid biosynthesis glycosyltransferase